MFTKVIGVALLMFTLVVQASAETPQVQTITEADSPANEEQTDDMEKDSTNVPPVSGQELKTEPAEQPEKAEASKHNTEVSAVVVSPGGEGNSFDFWIMIFTGVLALFTAVLAIATIGLWRASVKQSEEIKGSVDTTKKNAETFQNLMTAQMRAYLMPENGSLLVAERDDGKVIEAFLQFKNTGQTPAKDIVIEAIVDIFPLILPPGFEFGNNYTFRLTQGVIPPGAGRGFNVFLERKVLPEEFEEIIANKFGIYAWGVYTYRDVLTNEKRTTEFGHVFFWNRETKGFVMRFSNKHNTAD